jgi:hypothetical protein
MVVGLKDGVLPLADIGNPKEVVDVGEVLITLGPGKWRLRCRCEGNDLTGTSTQSTMDYDVLERTTPPDLLATAGIPFPNCSSMYMYNNDVRHL